MGNGGKKGGKNRKKGKRSRMGVQHQKLITRTEDQQYAVITKMLGDCRVELRYINDMGKLVETMGIIRGKLRRRVWMNVGNVVLVAERDYDKKVDIIDKYNDDSVRKLKRRGEIHPLLLDDYDDKKGAKIETDGGGECDGFEFDNGEDDAIEKVEVTKTASSAATTINDVDVINTTTEEDFNWDEL